MQKTMVPGEIDVSELLIKTCGLACWRGKISLCLTPRSMEKCSSVGQPIPRFCRGRQFAPSGWGGGLFSACLGTIDFVGSHRPSHCSCVLSRGDVDSTDLRLILRNVLFRRSARAKKCKSGSPQQTLISYEPDSTRALTACITNLVVAPGPDETRCCST